MPKKIHRKIKFTAPERVKGRPFTGGVYFKDGEIKTTDKDLPFKVAQHLVETWPDRFEWVGGPVESLQDSGKDSEDSSTDSSSSGEDQGATDLGDGNDTPPDPDRPTLDLSVLDSNELAAYTRAKNKLDADPPGKLTAYERETAIKVGDSRVEVDG